MIKRVLMAMRNICDVDDDNEKVYDDPDDEVDEDWRRNCLP